MVHGDWSRCEEPLCHFIFTCMVVLVLGKLHSDLIVIMLIVIMVQLSLLMYRERRVLNARVLLLQK